jgi:hypothetical protein
MSNVRRRVAGRSIQGIWQNIAHNWGLSMDQWKRTAFCIAFAICATRPSFANDKVPDVLATLLDAKAQAEGAASRVQSCYPLAGTSVYEELVSRYDKARSPHNARLESWLFVLRNRQGISTESALELEQMEASLAKIRQFIERAHAVLQKVGCGPNKVALKEIIGVAISLIPLTLEVVVKLFTVDDKERAEVIKALEQRKIKPWDTLTAYVIFDWSKDEYLSDSQITDLTLRKGSTSVYVNKWALKRNPGPLLVVDKQPPEGLEGSYILYTGKIEDLKRFTGEKVNVP